MIQTVYPDCAIVTHHLQKTYRIGHKNAPQYALKGIDLEIPRGSIFGLLGPNGAGKSTFINIIAGLVIKTHGEVSIWNFDLDKHPRHTKASIGLVPQEIVFDPFFTPYQSVELQAGLYGVRKDRHHVLEVLDAVGLADQAHSHARTLSGGMKRRLLIAKALIHDPPILILDEPTAGVDIELRKKLWEYIRALNERGVTILLTTHYLEEAQTLCDMIAIINDGELMICDDTQTLLSQIDRKTLVIRPETPLKEIPSGLLAYGQLRDNGSLELTYNPHEIHAGDLLTHVHQANITIVDIESEGLSLETVFMQLTH